MNKLIFLSAILIASIMFLNCKKESNEKEILSFTVPGQIGETSIHADESTVLVVVGLDVDLTDITPEITISGKAGISPPSGVTTDFSSGSVIYTVTAEDGSKKQWTVTVTHELRTGAEIVSFSFDTLQIGETLIDTSTNSVSIVLISEIDTLNTSPIIIVSDGAAISPASGQPFDFSVDSALYVVTAENGTQQSWYVKVTISPSDKKEVLSVSIPNQVGEQVWLGKSIMIEVPIGTDLTSIPVTFELSPMAYTVPASGVPQDFSASGSVTYRVYSESGYYDNYKILVGYPTYKADNPNIQYVGRIDFTNPKAPRYWMSGVYAKAKFSGTYCDIIINDLNQNYLEIVVDDTTCYRFKTPSSGINTLKTITGLPDGEHTVLICKNTEPGKGYIEFLGLRCDSLLTPDPLPSLKMEFIGNSITCGAGSDQTLVSCGAGAYEDQHNAYMSYGPIVARKLNAQWHVTAYSGIGLIKSCCGISYNMPGVYNRMNMNPYGQVYDVSQYIPDVVTLCLGQNDGVIDSTLFCTKYIEFIGTLRGYYPDAQIVLLTSPMADNSLLPFMKGCLTGIVDYMNTHGDNEVYKYFFSQRYFHGCTTHPSMAEHELIASELEIYINSILP